MMRRSSKFELHGRQQSSEFKVSVLILNESVCSYTVLLNSTLLPPYRRYHTETVESWRIVGIGRMR